MMDMAEEKIDFPFDTIDEMIEKVAEGLRRWRNQHADKDTWIDAFCSDSGIRWAWERCGRDHLIESDIFSVDWGEQAYLSMAESWDDEASVLRCPNCEKFVLQGDEDYNEEMCSECEEELERLDEDDYPDFADWLAEAEFTPSDYDLEQGLDACWPEIYQGIRTIVGGVIDECDSALEGLESSDNAERLTAMMMAVHIMHYSGNIVKDHSEFNSIEYSVVNEISEGGLIVCFTQEEIDEWLNQ